MQENLSADQMRTLYRKLFSDCPDGELPMDASTGYSKLPWGNRAIDALGAIDQGDTKAIYIIRGREQRAASQYRHECISRGSANDDHCRRFSLYAPVIRAWIRYLGPDRFRVVSISSLQSETVETMSEIGRFLSVASRILPHVHNSPVRMNRTIDMRSPRSHLLSNIIGRIRRSAAYKTGVARMMPRSIKGVLQGIITRKAKPIDFDVPDAWRSDFDHDRDEVVKIKGLYPDVFIRDSELVR
jgi:hypothetical protein